MKVYYWNHRQNFGDVLGPLLLKRFCRIDAEWSEAKDSDIVLVGSVLEHLPKDYTGIIAGAGKLHEKTELNLRKANFLAVRGPLTASGLKKDLVLADPGLLADELVQMPEKEYNLGVIPHWTDKVLEFDPRFTKYNPKIIRVSGDPLEVIHEIGKCKKVVSSSLHGIVLADAFGIPRRIEIAPRMLSHPHQEGGLFKWRDYTLSLGMELEIGVTQEPDRNKITEKQHELFDVFQEIKSLIQKEKETQS